ncbi:arylamine N-acetyltransferase family protein [Parvularcula sp. LCG005]|uniref:arylamine N-acetyltransferase family protein n=1 Tax=Parvularcula sp. LCG005 TaxID=3078805 RepID=UPI0029434768|nr:arylamine N-acetyltransferase [Parvularcula sp. LCG005]WOI52447.1 arylamine N-acetyltransferase [Parvularcula sp. LCG005]
MDVDAYLQRIGISTRPASTLAGLAELQGAHILAVPFENLDIPLGYGISLDRAHIFDKIVNRRRGGYCFELNGLFGDLLRALGFDARPILARVWYRNPPQTSPLTHTLNLVTVDDHPYLVDVGFGGTTARCPIPFRAGAEVTDADGGVRLEANDEFGTMLYRQTNEGWMKQFSVTGALAYPMDMEMGNHFTSTSPLTHFTSSIVAGRFTPVGRHGLVGRTLTIREGWGSVSREVSDDEFEGVLASSFGIDLGADADRLIAKLPPLT